MPWRASDAKRHVKGLTPRQARAWATVANDALKRCRAQGKSQAACEGQAIRQANAAAKRVGTRNNEAALHAVSLTINNAADLIRYEDIDGHTVMIVPCVAIVEGVLNGAYVSAEEIGKHAQAWADAPLPINHPMENGFPVSAKTPAVLASSVVGRFQNPSFDGKRLAGELWIDVERAKTLPDGLEIIQRLEAGDPLEISTAFYADFDATPGTFRGKRFEGAHRNLVPDHVALLPHAIGACDWQSGCGAPRINCTTCQGGCQGGCMPQTHDKGHLTAAIHAIRDMILGSRAENLTEDDLFEVDEEHRVSITGDAEEVQQDTRYIPVDGEPTLAGNTRADADPPTKEEGMDTTKEPVVQALIGHAHTAWTETDKDLLLTFSAEQLKRLEEEANARAEQAEAATQDEDETEEESEAEEAAAHPVTQAVKPKTGVIIRQGNAQPVTLEAIQTLITQAVEQVNESLDTRLAGLETQMSQRQERQQLLTHLAGHGWSEDDTQGMSIDQLRKLASTVLPASFSGMGLPAFATQAHDDGPSDDPDWS